MATGATLFLRLQGLFFCRGEAFCFGVGGGGEAEALFEGGAEIFDVGKTGQVGGFLHGVITGAQEAAGVLKAQLPYFLQGGNAEMLMKEPAEIDLADEAFFRKGGDG